MRQHEVQRTRPRSEAGSLFDPLTGLLRGRGAVVIAGGPSLAPELPLINGARARGVVVIGVNYTAFRLGWPQFAVVYDWETIESPGGPINPWAYGGVVFAPANRITEAHHNLVPVELKPDAVVGLSDAFCRGLYSNGGAAGLAISVAWVLAADPILLAGFDLQGDRHWYDRTAVPICLGPARDSLEALSAQTGNRVINCSAETALSGFPRGHLETEIERLIASHRRRAPGAEQVAAG